ncbi:MAG TPA: hypothetical protein VFQ87_04070 [Bradyrhizobium sp.]|nr:hypothetical protein [Bradyrhizobium sp.]
MPRVRAASSRRTRTYPYNYQYSPFPVFLRGLPAPHGTQVSDNNRRLAGALFLQIEGNGSIFNDEEATLLSGVDVAMLLAAVIAAELAQDDGEYQGYMVRIADEHGSDAGLTAVEDTSR